VRAAALLVPIAFCAACVSGGPYAPDVQQQFAREYTEIAVKVPSKEDLLPWKASDAMTGTLRSASAYLERASLFSTHARYVRSLKACAHLLRGETERAWDLVEPHKPPLLYLLSHENGVVEATIHAVDACRALQARLALDELFEERIDPRTFVERYGFSIGIWLPPEGRAARDRLLKEEAELIRTRCIIDIPGDPHGMERVAAGRRDLRQQISEQIYNDAAALLGALPERRCAETEWLAALAVSLFIVHGYLMPDLLPVKLREEQKQWQRELAFSIYAQAKEAASNYLRGEKYMLMRYRLDAAEMNSIGWISTR
jgi:hypothetical protein